MLLSSNIGFTVPLISAPGSSLQPRILIRTAHHKTNEVISPLAYSGLVIQSWGCEHIAALNVKFTSIVICSNEARNCLKHPAKCFAAGRPVSYFCFKESDSFTKLVQKQLIVVTALRLILRRAAC